jgi:beta-lactamase regulating signal transducer with metallopeptidase domain
MSSFLAALADHALLVCVGLLVAAALAVPARALLRRDPVTCYRLLFALLIGAVAVVPLQWLVAGRAAPLATPLRDWLRERSQGDALTDPDRDPPLPRESRASHEGIYLVDAEPAPRSCDGSPAAAADGALEAKGRPGANPAWGANDATSDPTAPPAAFLAGGLRLRDEQPLGRWVDAIRDHRAEFAGGAAILWLAGFAGVAGRRLLRVARTRRLIARSRDVADPDVVALWRRVVRGSRGADRVRLVESSEVTSPACAGLVRRIVIVPAGARAPARGEAPAIAPGVLEWALRHELVHLERGDAWAALFQSAVTALLWFHPAAWWLSSEIGRLRELSCDRQVVEGSGRRKSYALALLEYAACASKHFPAVDADPHSAGVRHALLHWSRSPSQIRRRIEMLTVDPASLPRARQWLGALVAGCAFAVPALAQVAGAATLLPPRPVQEATPVAPLPTPPPARVELPSVPATPAIAPPAPPAPADDGRQESPAPRARRRVTPPPGTPVPAPAPEAKPLPPQDVAPEPALAPVRRPMKVRAVAGVEDPEDVIEYADDGHDGDDGEDEAGRRIASTVEQKMRASQRQIEQAVRQAQRSTESHQRDLERELQKLEQQAGRLDRQGAQKRESLQRKLADADGDDKKKLESELVELERQHHDQRDEVTARCQELERGLAALEDVDFDACRESLAAMQEASAVDSREIQRAVEEGVVAQRRAHAELQKLGYVDGEGDGDGPKGEGAQAEARRKHVRDVHAAVERALAQSREATERACAQAADAVAHAKQRGALTPAQQEQVERALKQARDVDHDAIRAQVEKALARAQDEQARAQGQDETRRSRVRAKQPAADPAASAAPGTPKRPRVAKPPQDLPPSDPVPRDAAPRAGGRASGGRPSDGRASNDREAMLQQHIQMLEQQIDALRAELEALRQQAPAAPPARHGRELR